MENELYKKEFEKTKLADIVIEDEKMSFVVNGTKVGLESNHDQDCCEHVYADFSVMKYQKEELEREFNKITLKPVPKMGFLVCFISKGSWYEESLKVFIPCYNQQNGYYSSDLALDIRWGEEHTKVDISDLVEDNID